MRGARPRGRSGQLLPVVSQVVKATLDETHPDLPVGEPADERTQQLLRLVDQPFGEMDLKRRTGVTPGGGHARGAPTLPRAYRVLVLHQVPQQRVALLADVVQVDVGERVAAVLVFVNWTCWDHSTSANRARVCVRVRVEAHPAPGARGRWRPGWGGAAGGGS